MMEAATVSDSMKKLSVKQLDGGRGGAPKEVKNRRKRRGRKGDQDTLASTVENARVFRGRIHMIMDPHFGFVLNQRDASIQCVIDNIYKFTSEPCVPYRFVTDQQRIPHARPVEIMHPFAVWSTDHCRTLQTWISNQSTRSQTIPVFTASSAGRDASDSNSVYLTSTVVQPPRLAKTAIEWARQPFVVPNYIDCGDRNSERKQSKRKGKSRAESTGEGDGSRSKDAPRFERYISQDKALAGLQAGIFGKGEVRINPKNFKEAFITPADRMQLDYYIPDVARRNRALEGDIVVFELLDELVDERRCVKVVYMAERVHPRTAIGNLSVAATAPGKARMGSFMPRDRRFPRMNIMEKSLPDGFFDAPSAFANILVEAELIEWTSPTNAVGVTLEIVGSEASVAVETQAILAEHHVDWKPYSVAALKQLPHFDDAVDEEIANRLDLRGECIFTIDPANARDLDDAVSIRTLPNGNFIVGVHISDVSFFLKENSYIDTVAMARATSTYLPNTVIHMLPLEMCHACSLLPGRDSLTFTVQWELTPRADIVSTSFARTVINSCTQLSYEHAQMIIDQPDAPVKNYRLPPLLRFKREQLRDSVNGLHVIARSLRRRRDDAGALRIEQIKLGVQFRLDGTPETFTILERGTANEMIEEFMLLANMSVAEKIYASYPRMAMLRLHQNPHPLQLSKLKDQLENVGVHLHTANSFTLARSLERYNGGDYLSRARFIALNHLMKKPMVRAEYACAGNLSPREFHHYALNATFYTHFTSPIRRYIDIVVHRILAAALSLAPLPKATFAKMERIARNCNLRKLFSKLAADAFIELSVARCIETRQPYITEAVVIKVLDRSFDAIVLNTGTVVRIYAPDFDLLDPVFKSYGSSKQYKALQLTFPAQYNYPDCRVIIDLFQVVRVALRRKKQTNRLEATFITVITELPRNMSPATLFKRP